MKTILQMNQRLIIFQVMLMLLFISSCEVPNESRAMLGNASVYGVLIADSSQQRLYVYRTTTLNELLNNPESVAYYTDLYTDEANVMINNIALPDTGIEVFDSSFVPPRRISYDRTYLLNAAGFVLPATTYNLRVTYKGSVMTGKTTVPERPVLTNPAPDSNVSLNGTSYQQVSVRWNASRFAKGYQVNVTYPAYQYMGTNMPAYTDYILTIETSANITLYKYKTGQHKIIVTAFDENYVKAKSSTFYQSESNSDRKPIVAAGIENGYGVFGARISSDTLKINVLP